MPVPHPQRESQQVPTSQAKAIRLANESPSYVLQVHFKLLPLHWSSGQVSPSASSLKVSRFPTALQVFQVFKAKCFGGSSLCGRSQKLGCLLWNTSTPCSSGRSSGSVGFFPIVGHWASPGVLGNMCLCLSCSSQCGPFTI